MKVGDEKETVVVLRVLGILVLSGGAGAHILSIYIVAVDVAIKMEIANVSSAT